MLIVTGYVRVAPWNLVAFNQDLQELAKAARQRDGNLFYDAAVVDPLGGRLLVTERWKDQGALSAHLGAEDTMAFVHRWEGRLTSEILKFDAMGERGLMDD